MSYIQLDDLKSGIDRRRTRVNGVPGSLWRLVNGHITRGGEIERSKRWVPTFTLPAGTFGLSSINNELFVFGSGSGAGVPVGVTYEQLAIQSGADMTRVVAVEAFRSQNYVVAEYDNGETAHFYAGSRVTQWVALGAGAGSVNAIADLLASKINESNTHSATAASGVITITANDDDIDYPISVAAINGGTNNDQTISFVETQAPTSILPQIYDVTLGGTFEAQDRFRITLNGINYVARGRASGTGNTLLTFRRKMYSTVSTFAYFSAIDEPANWTTGVGAGFIDQGAQNASSEPLTAMAEYEGKIAFFSENAVRIWAIDPDPALNAHLQTLQGTGTVSPRSPVSYGSRDVFYLHSSGVRSLRPRDSSGTATVDDVGTAIDSFIQAHMATLTVGQITRAPAVFEPRDGRYWLALGDRVYVFSHFPSNKISAWSYYEPGFEITDFATVGSRIYARAGNTIYLYGGASGDEYPGEDETPVLVEFPYLSGKTPATFKNFKGFDVALEGEWEVNLFVDPNNEDEAAAIAVGTIYQTTYSQLTVSAEFQATHVAPRFRCSAAGRASIGSMSIHYDDVHEAR